MAEPITVVLADDHPLMRDGIRATLTRDAGLRVVGEASDAYEALDLALTLRPRLLVLDLNMPGPPAAEVVRHLAGHRPGTRVLVLTAYDDDARVRELLDAGAGGYLVKDVSPAVVLRAARQVADGGTWFPGSLVERVAEGEALDEREQGVLRELAAGKTDAEIGAALYLSQRTVRRVLRDLSARWGADSRVDLAVRAVELGLGPKQP
ncbi:MAG: response regulator transcription factor [Chloroflexi bacterium]|nr:response regulator transcription factor [Chloroflexota bacterium]